jgi:hypothetical protein
MRSIRFGFIATSGFVGRAGFIALLIGALSGAGRDVFAQEDPVKGDSTYRVILYLAEGGAPTDVTLTRLHEVWAEGESVARIQGLLRSGQVQQLEDVTILPGRETPALQIGGVTVRVTGAYKEPRRDAMFLRVEVDGGPEALVKELISRFDETIILAYPLAEGNRTVVALLVPAPTAGN